jgi:hypothetical protein
MSNRLDLKREFKRVRPTKQLHLSRCSLGKVRYRDKQEALNTLHKIQVKARYEQSDAGQTNRRECRAYECDCCHGFHLTSKVALKIDQLLAS